MNNNNRVLDFYIEGIHEGKIPKHIYKFYKINKNLENCLKEKYLWCSSPNSFNDPFDTMYNKNSHVHKDQIIGSDDIWVKQEFSEIFNSFAKNQRISCFSDLNSIETKEILMWSHYGDNHKGLCLKFDLLNMLEYWNDNYPWIFFHKVIYEINFPEIPIEYMGNGKVEATVDFLRTKSLDWKYEQEYRVFHSENKLPYPKDSLIETRFGCLTTKNDIKKIKKISDSHLRFIKANKSITSFKLEYEEID
ncbi:MAG: DUF2971 domain-containing protein [Candidatus Delongbacteria bacterium]|nr:DUF2971 domain-containing protein [Candidatus Delongbacteria bacterium]